MSDDPKKYLNPKCPKGLKTIEELNANKKQHFSALKKLGGLEAWNDIGFGKVGEGLRAITAVSDTIRLGGTDPTIPDNEKSGGNWVLSHVGAESSSFNKLFDFSPSTANRTVNQAKEVWRRTKAGNFQISDIPTYFAGFQEAVNLASSIWSNDDKTLSAKNGAAGKLRGSMCSPSPFAMDLIQHAPKYKFLFIVDITLAEPYNSWENIGSGTAFVVYNSTRPSVEFEYEEVNMYNFWTRVPKRTIYQPMSMKFYDDSLNNAHLFYTAYMRAMSPLANLKLNNNMDGNTKLLQERSMDFNNPNTTKTFDQNGPQMDNEYAASLGPLLDNVTSVIKTIKLFHVFQYGALMNSYVFSNPKITSLELDELTMQDSGPTEFSMNFVYDKLYTEVGIDVKTKELGYDIEALSSKNIAKYPLNPIFGNDHDVREFQPNAPSAETQETTS